MVARSRQSLAGPVAKYLEFDLVSDVYSMTTSRPGLARHVHDDGVRKYRFALMHGPFKKVMHIIVIHWVLEYKCHVRFYRNEG